VCRSVWNKPSELERQRVWLEDELGREGAMIEAGRSQLAAHAMIRDTALADGQELASAITTCELELNTVSIQ